MTSTTTHTIACVVVLVAAAALAVIRFDEILEMLRGLAGAFKPVAYGAVIAYLLNLIMARLEGLPILRKEGKARAKVRRPLCIAASMAIVLLVFGSAIAMAALQLKDSVAVVAQGLTAAWTAVADLVGPLEAEGGFAALFGGTSPDWASLIEDAAARFNGFGGLIGSAAGVGNAVVGTAVDLGLGLVFACYLLMAKERVLAGAQTFARTVLPEHWRKRVITACSTLNASFSRFISGQCLEAVILGSLCAAGMAVLRLPHALTVGLIVGITALVPVFGAWVGGAIGALMILPYSTQQALVFVIFLVLLQQVENHFIYPRTMGSATGISTIWVMAAVVVGGALGGIVGMMAAVPVVAAATQLLEGVWKRDEEGRAAADEARR